MWRFPCHYKLISQLDIHIHEKRQLNMKLTPMILTMIGVSIKDVLKVVKTIIVTQSYPIDGRQYPLVLRSKCPENIWWYNRLLLFLFVHFHAEKLVCIDRLPLVSGCNHKTPAKRIYGIATLISMYEKLSTLANSITIYDYFLLHAKFTSFLLLTAQHAKWWPEIWKLSAAFVYTKQTAG